MVPRGYVRFFGKLAELADSGIAITWITGNHDIWIFDYLPSELGIRVIDGPIIEEIDGHRFLLDHGDKVGKQPLPYRIMSGIFHNRICQRLYAALHPRLTLPFATGWSKSNRVSRKPINIDCDIERGLKIVRDFSQEHSAQHPDIDFYIYGHLHRWDPYWTKHGWGMSKLLRNMCLPSTGHWGDIGYVLFRAEAHKGTATFVQKDFFFSEPAKDGEMRLQEWDDILSDRSRDLVCTFRW